GIRECFWLQRSGPRCVHVRQSSYRENQCVGPRARALPEADRSDWPAVGKDEHVQACMELLDNIEVFVRPCRLFGAVDELSERDDGSAKLIGIPIETVTELNWALSDRIDADVGIEHTAQHHNGSRFSAGGSRRSAMKSSDTLGTSKKSSQDRSAGLISRL